MPVKALMRSKSLLGSDGAWLTQGVRLVGNIIQLVGCLLTALVQKGVEVSTPAPSTEPLNPRTKMRGDNDPRRAMMTGEDADFLCGGLTIKYRGIWPRE